VTRARRAPRDDGEATDREEVGTRTVPEEDEGDRGPVPTWQRVLLGVLPAEDGGPPPILQATRARLTAWLWTAIGFVIGGAVGLLLVLLLRALPATPPLLVGFGLGVLLGAGVALILASRLAFVRRGGAVLLLLSPLLLLLSPFLLLGAGLFASRKLPRPPAARDARRER
jgi:hypothetical protein